MAFLLGCEKAAVEFPTKTVFSCISLGVDEGYRIGIVGRNGDGKSTLLRLLAGLVQPDEGRVLTTRGTRVGILGQADALDTAATVKQAILGDMTDYAWAKDNSIKGILARHLDVLANSATRRMFQMERPQKEAEANLEEERAI